MCNDMVKVGCPVGGPMNDPLVCVVLNGTTIEEMLDEAARSNLAGADLVEVRYDRLFLISPEVSEDNEEDELAYLDTSEWGVREPGDIDISAIIPDLKEGIPLPVIFTIRSQNEGGHYPGEESARIELLREAIASGVSWVDLEISIEEGVRKELVEAANAGKCKIISSIHGDSVPPAEEIVDMVKSNSDNCEIIKLCFETANHHESLNLVEASIEMTGSGISYAIMGMGPGGDWPRLHAPMLEQSIVYTTLHSEYKLSEKGLINVKDARDAWALLEY